MIKNVIFFRHGETLYPVDESGRKLSYPPDAPLTEHGRLFVKRAGDYLVHYLGNRVAGAIIHSSPYTRALQTAQILKGSLGIDRDVILWNDLRDVDTPRYIGKPIEELPKDYYHNPPEGHETLPMLVDRGRRVFQEILKIYNNSSVHIIVSHRDTILGMLFWLRYKTYPVSLEDLLHDMTLERGEGVIIKIDGFGQLKHLEGKISVEGYGRRKQQ